MFHLLMVLSLNDEEEASSKKHTQFKTRIKRDFLKHKTVKTNDKIRRFGVFMTPLSRKI